MESMTTIHLTPTKMRIRNLRQSRRRTQQRSKWDPADQKTTRVSLLGTMDWLLLVASFIFIIISVLLISNGTCSHSRGLSASAPVCIGGHLSVQSWLAIVGVESGALGIIIPRVSRLLVSKYLTHRLVYHGLGLAKILNSQTTAPLRAQLVHGSNAVFCFRIPFLVATVAFSILYKWSFVKVSRFDTFPLSTTNLPIPLGYDATGHITTVSNNLVDALDPSNPHSSLFVFPLSSENSSNANYTQIFGPSLNPITLSAPSNQVSTGTLTFCAPSFYSDNTIVSSSPSWVPPMLTTDSNGDGLRITNTDGSLIDISSANGTITIMAGIFGQTDVTPHYTSYLSANVSVCKGYVSWAINNVLDPSSSAISTTPLLQTPIDITCIMEPFDLDTWMSASTTEFVLRLLQGLSWTSDDLAKRAMDIVLSTIDHTSSIATLDTTSLPSPTTETHPNFDPSSNSNSSSTSNPNSTSTANFPTDLAPPACSLLSSKSTPTSASDSTSTPQPQWIVSGQISDFGTGQTLLGTILQACITLFSLLTLLLLFTPGLPLITEWSAQWLGLVYGLAPPRVQECVEGTSAGGNNAREAGEEIEGPTGGIREDGEVIEDEREKRRGDLSVFLGSAGGDGPEGNPYLVLGLEKTRVRRGWGHV
ncbi:uncharacterized protein LY89DRAFT_729247 [Mollisia scopiformis]|uniref:Uncharacterized protein n=1 Tax=Mollisia scopiformis TaxID=149040 RepID=A0A194XNK2_MOLSC|nr:uncharacterized protein LY89DRAFT_729247 [Mollisia scopiformis]KUJ21743.1 hypothetical protein LY89DRAFT_729247 [Mollisia scopiformis]